MTVLSVVYRPSDTTVRLEVEIVVSVSSELVTQTCVADTATSSVESLGRQGRVRPTERRVVSSSGGRRLTAEGSEFTTHRLVVWTPTLGDVIPDQHTSASLFRRGLRCLLA